jgi:hypothetical protein
MAELTPQSTVAAKNPAEDGSGGQTLPPSANDKPNGIPTGRPVVDRPAPRGSLPVRSLKLELDILPKAELLLGYAAEAGIEVNDTVRDGILNAKVAFESGSITAQDLDDLLTSFTTLASVVQPVTVESLEASQRPEQARALIRFYGRVAIGIGLVIVFFSLITFASGSLSAKIKADVDTANALASKLRVELGPSPTNAVLPTPSDSNSQDAVWFGPAGVPSGLTDKEVISDLQQFAAAMREIYGYSRQLNYFVWDAAHDPYTGVTNRSQKLELMAGLDVRLAHELTERVEEYQKVRNFGNNVQERVTVLYGAIATCFLPVLYALLGAGAYLLRLYEDQMKNRTLVPGDRHVARFLIAGIGGLVVGLFSNATQGITMPPFAIAFLVGYAVDVFFAFLEGSLVMFRRTPGNATSQAIPKI